MDIVFYHGGCPDGWCAAVIAKRMWPSIEMVPALHGTMPKFSSIKGKNVLVVDFSWSLEICEEIRRHASQFQIIDHHVTAQAALKNFPNAVFDMGRSGAGLTWDTLYPKEPRPWYVDYVEDRDLWKFKLPNSKAVNAFIMALPHTVEAWSILEEMPVLDAASKGLGILLHIHHYVENAVKQRFPGKLIGRSAAVVNAPYMNCSDIGDKLCEYAEVGVIWFERGDGQMQFSLRSQVTNVAIIAQMHGGGGHEHAAGFQLPLVRGRAVLDEMLGRTI